MARFESPLINNKMTTCKTCGADIAKTAKTCPSCGARRSVPLMVSHPVGGSILLVVLILFSVILFAALSSETGRNSPANSTADANNTQPVSATEVSTPTTEDPPILADPDALGDWEISVNSFEVTEAVSAGMFTEFKADDGNLYAVVTLTVKNVGNEAHTFLPILAIGDDITAKITYQDYEYSAATLIGYDDDLHYKQVNPLSSATGIIAFQIVKDVAQSGELNLVLTCGSKTLTYELK